jgi:DNA-binding response OmpR family regulator
MKNIKVLLVDDEEEFVQSLAERIRMRELGSEVALNGNEALAKLGEKLPDVMILDFYLPGIDGLTILEQVKKTYPEVQVVMLRIWALLTTCKSLLELTNSQKLLKKHTSTSKNLENNEIRNLCRRQKLQGRYTERYKSLIIHTQRYAFGHYIVALKSTIQRTNTQFITTLCIKRPSVMKKYRRRYHGDPMARG